MVKVVILVLGALGLMAQDHPLDPSKFEEVATLRGHSGKALCVSFSLDGKYLASGGEDRTLKVWEAATGKLIRAFPGHRGYVCCAALSPDGSLVAGSVGEKSVRVYDVKTGKELSMFQDIAVVEQLMFSHDGTSLISLAGGRVNMRDVKETSKAVRLGGDDWIAATRIALTTDEKYIAQVSLTGVAQLCDVTAGTVLKQVERLGGPLCVTVTPTKSHLVYPVGSDIVALNLKTEKEWRFKKAHKGDVSWLAATPDGKYVVSAGADGEVRVWNIQSYTARRTLKGNAGDVTWLEVSSDAKRVAASSTDGSIRIWNLETGSLDRTIEAHEHKTFSVAVSGDGAWLLSTGADRTGRLWDLKEFKQAATCPTSKEPSISEWAAGAFRPKDKFVYLTYEEKPKLGDKSCVLKSWPIGGGESNEGINLLKEKKEDSATVYLVHLSSDGSLIAVFGKFGSVAIGEAAHVRLFSDTGKLLREIQDSGLESMALSPDDKQVALLSTELKLWDTRTGAVTRLVRFDQRRPWPRSPQVLAFTSDGKNLVYPGDPSKLAILKIESREVVREIDVGTGIQSVAASEACLAVGCQDGKVRLFNPASGKLIKELGGHRGEVHGLAFSKDGGLLISAGLEIKVWAVK